MSQTIFKRNNDSDEDEDRPRMALPFDNTGKPFDESHVPTTGNEYLRKVHHEAMKCPQTVVAAIDPAKLQPAAAASAPVSPEKLPCPSGFEASMEWQLEQVSLFSDVRQKFALQKSRSKTTSSGWKYLSKVSTAAEWADTMENEGNMPLVSVVASISGGRILQFIRWHVELTEKKFSVRQGRWLYAFLAALEKPLSPEAFDTLRALARAASRARAKLGLRSAEITEGDTSEMEEVRERITSLNLIICLVSRYFSQTDLAD